MSTVSEQKAAVVEKTVALLKKYDVIAAADLNKVQSGMLMDLRKRLRGQLEIKTVKNTLMRISMEQAEKPATAEFIKAVAGQNMFLFTNGNPFKLAMNLEKSKVESFAKPGDKALKELTVPAGNTGISPGPMISKFGALGVKTRIEAGNIWVVADTVVADKGDEITADMADLLQRLGIKAAQSGLSLKVVYERGMIIPGADLIIDVPSFRKQLMEAAGGAFSVALKGAYVSTATAPTLLSMAQQQAKMVAVEAGYVTPDTAADIIAKANAQAKSLQGKVDAKKTA
ncbi:MAG: 50S ribosomal protein L10 [Candidatus Bathyarchaeota archaeon]|nr:50S ribosomal protein L10 [Candidatus Bathyarchaeota archaeon]